MSKSSGNTLKKQVVAVATFLLPITLITPVNAAPGTFAMGADVSYTEDAAAISALSDFTLTDNSQNYGGGSITLSMAGSYDPGEILSFTSSTPSTTNGAISFNNGTVYKGDGSSANAIGSVDASLNGQGKALKINFNNAFANGDFSQGASGWTVTNSRVYLGYIKSDGTVVQGTTSIAGFTPPIDAIWGPGNVDSSRDLTSGPNVPSHSFNNNLTMTMGGGSCQAGYCVLRGPYVVSNSAVYLTSGDSVSFDWSASAAGDGFDVFGYLVNTANGKAIKLIDETGRDSRAAGGSVTATLGSARNETGYFTSGTRRTDLKRYVAGGSATTGASTYDDSVFTDGTSFVAGNYKFVFIAGSYDDSGGQYLGATFTIDNVSVTATNVATITAADVQSLVRQFSYSNTSGAISSRSLGFTSSVSDTASDDGSKTISIATVNDAPSFSAIAAKSYTDTSAVNTFTAHTATLSATDEEGSSITYGLTGATVSVTTATLTDSNGSISLNTSTGSFTFTPNAATFNGYDTNQVITYTFTASDGTNTTSATFTINLTAAIDAAPGVPQISSVTALDQSLSVTFTPPASTGTSSIVNYKYSTDGTNYLAFSPAQTSSPLSIQYLSTDGTTRLTNGTAYPITIKAVNATDDSVASNSVNGTPAVPASNSSSGGGSSVAATPTPTPTATTRTTPRAPQPLAGPVNTGTRPSQVPAEPTALIGGVPTTTTARVIDQSKLNILAGALNLEVQVKQDQGTVTRNDSGGTQLEVRKGSSTTITGSGVRPFSTVQVFLPLQGENAKEIARIPTTATGTFNGQAVFATQLKEMPLPIGRQVLQIVSADPSGSQAVVEMTVNIAQPAPAPEQNRDNGELPELPPGSSIATRAGVPVPVTIEAIEQEGQAIVQGDGWNMSIDVPDANGQVTKTDGGALLKFVQNETVFVQGDGFLPGTRADVWLFSDPTLLGTVDIDENGNFSGQIAVDGKFVPTGEHTLQVQGVGTDGYVRAANLGVVVEANPVASSSALSSIWAYVLIAVGLGTTWWFFIVARRRRKEAKHT
jgi:hypothetical protein